MRDQTKKIKAEIRDLRKEEGMEKLIHLSYDRLASGSRYPYRPKEIDPETAEAIRRAFGIPATRGMQAKAVKARPRISGAVGSYTDGENNLDSARSQG